MDRTGNPQTLSVPHQPYEAPRLSPDGQRVAVGINNGASGGERNIWIYDFARSNLSRLTSEKEEAETLCQGAGSDNGDSVTLDMR